MVTPTSIIDRMPPVDPTFLAALKAEDELGMVLRAHIHVESRVNAYLEATVPVPEQLRDLGLRYSQRVQIAAALGLPKEMVPGLQVLGRIRNAFSHRLETALTKEMVEGLEQAITQSAGSIVAQGFQLTVEHYAKEGVKPTSRPLKDRFVFAAVYLERIVTAYTVQAQHGGANDDRTPR